MDERVTITEAILSFAVTLVLIFVIYAGLGALNCKGQTSGIGVPARYMVFGGCQVQEKGNWIPLINWRYFGD